jgi:DNA-binding transcriptional LysR family regulator
MSLPWSLIEAFIGVADAGSLTGAAGALGLSQPTLSRQIQALEEHLGVTLFVRHARGLTLSERGVELLASARQVDQQVDEFLRRATGMRAEPEGSVRISAAEPIAVHVLNPAFRELRRSFAQISIEIVADNSVASLSRREADIAVRMMRPVQLDLVAKRLGAIPIALYASAEYIAVHGQPGGIDDVDEHTLIGFDRDDYWLAAVARMGLRPEHFRFRSDSILVQIEAARAGVGIAALHVNLARRHPDLVPVLPGLALPDLEVWLVVHQDLRGDPAVRAVLAALEHTLREYLSG